MHRYVRWGSNSRLFEQAMQRQPAASDALTEG
jgi:hypothetical protein